MIKLYLDSKIVLNNKNVIIIIKDEVSLAQTDFEFVMYQRTTLNLILSAGITNTWHYAWTHIHSHFQCLPE